MTPRTRALARRGVLVMLGSFAVLWFVVILTGGVGPPGQDIDRVRLAAMRVRVGEPLYTNVGDPNLFYTWAPWLAWLWIPLTFLPRAPVAICWMVVCFVAWAFSLWPARQSLPLILLVAPLTFYGAWVGNVQPLLLAGLIWTTPTRWAVVAVGVAASLKISPILFVLPWVRNREWRKVIAAVLIALALGSPALASGIDRYPFVVDPQISLRQVSNAAWAVAALVAIGIALAVRAENYKWLASAVAVVVSRPSLLLYDVGYLLLPLARAGRSGDSAVPDCK